MVELLPVHTSFPPWVVHNWDCQTMGGYLAIRGQDANVADIYGSADHCTIGPHYLGRLGVAGGGGSVISYDATPDLLNML